MQVTLEIPDTLAADLTAAGKDTARAALEAMALEGYRNALLTETELRIMLGFVTRMEVHTFLAEHNVYINYTAEHLLLDIAASEKLHEQRMASTAKAA